MEAPRVGVLTEDPTLVVALGLRRSGMAFEEVEAPEALATHDLAVVDLPSARDLEILLGRVGSTPTVVVLSSPLPVPRDVSVVRRPCSVEQLLAALGAARTSAHRTVLLDEPAPMTGVDAPMFTSRTTRSAGTRRSSSPPAAAPRGSATGTSPRPTPLPARLAAQLRDVTGPAQQFGAPSVVSASLAERVAAAIQVHHRLDHVCLWSRFGESHVVLGVVGGGSAAHDLRLRDDHPTLQTARRAHGRFLRGPEEQPPHAPGLPGSWSMTFGVVLLEDVSGPVDVVTLSGPAITEETLQAVRDHFT